MSNKDLLQELHREASISVKKNRVKVYPNDTVYLKDKQEFEIELFNPTNVTRLAKISINGKLISNSGIVLKPGQRIYLERFIDSPEKFRFDTYIIDGSSEAALKATEDNGSVVVSFYDEYIAPSTTSITFTTSGNSGNASVNLNDLYYRERDLKKSKLSGGSIRTSGIKGQSASSYYSNVSNTGSNELMGSLSMDFMNEQEEQLKESAEKETGRVEKGQYSNQSFTNYYGNFNYLVSRIVSIKILPLSEKPIEKTDLANYCTECGSRNKGGKYKFCPNCGTKY